MPNELRFPLRWTSRSHGLTYLVWIIEFGIASFLVWQASNPAANCNPVAFAFIILFVDCQFGAPCLVICALYFPLLVASAISTWLNSLETTIREVYMIPPRRIGWMSLPAFPDSETPLLSNLASARRHDAYLTSRLCQECMQLVEHSKILSGSFYPIVKRVEWHLWPVQHQGLELETSKRTCHLCNVLWYSLPKQYLASHAPLLYGNVQRHQLWIKVWKEQNIHSFDQDRFYLQIFGGKQRRELCVPLSRALKVTEETSHGQPVSSRVSSSTESSDSIEFAKHWIGECNSNHGLHCSAPVLPGEQYLPKRLLYVGESSSGLPVLRLQGTASLALDPADVTYLALSYSRGDSYVKLTSKNKRAWETHIDQDSLPLSFQHAITLTRQLNFRYLWIDILCSIQDSPDDYLAESKEIGRVYASASCTISACASIDASRGCFQDRPCCPQEFPCYLRFSRGKALAIRADVPVDSEAFYAQVEESPLGQRGYALQERLLSRRVLHFGSRFVFFECRTLVASEGRVEGAKYRKEQGNRRCFPKRNRPLGSPEYNALTNYRAALDELRQGAFTNLDLDEELCMHRCWFRLVSKATVGKREAAERLHAVDSLALAIGGEKNNLGYIHGLWQRHLLFDLLWFIRSGQTEKPRQLRPPSWSWAAVDGAVDQQLMIDEKGFEGKKHVILKIATDTSASEPAQETDQGLLVLHCPVLRAVNLASSESHCQTVEVQSPHGGVQARFVPDTLDFDHVNDLVVAEIVREMVYDPSRQNRTPEIWSNGLVLRRIQHVSGRRGLVFQRIGRFWMEWPWYSPGFRPGAYIEKRVFGNGMVIRIA